VVQSSLSLAEQISQTSGCVSPCRAALMRLKRPR
jgi:hypothetical protein